VRNFPDIAQFYVDEVVAPSNQMLAQVIQRGVDRGEFRDVNVVEVVHALVGRWCSWRSQAFAGRLLGGFLLEPRS